MIDLVTFVGGIYSDQPEATCHRCEKPFEGRSVVFVLSSVPSGPRIDVVTQICVPCFQLKFAQWEKLAAVLAEQQP